MSVSVGASSSDALSYLQQLMQQGKAKSSDASKATDPLSMLMQSLSNDGSSSGQTGATGGTSSATSTGSSCPAFGSDTMAALISAQGQQTAGSAESKFFSKLDSNGDGQISQSEFEAAAGKVGVSSSTADAVFAKIDGNNDGSVSQSELTKADHGGHHHHHVGSGGGAGALNTLLSGAGANGATTQTATNADGSTTTTITYADGSKIDMTTPASASTSTGSDSDGDGDGSGGSSAKSSFSKSASNMLEQLIKLQSQMLTAATSTLSAVA